jgi:E3 ubiquitin-protein ligase makorin
MEWRTEGSDEVSSRRVCPTCRKESDFVVPSHVHPTTEVEKGEILRNYKERLCMIPCRNFDGDLGSCPFGSDCFYAHFDDDGKDIKSQDQTMQQLYQERQRHRNDRRGRYELEMITEMLLMMEMQRHLASERNNQGRRGQRDRRNRREGRNDDDEDNESEEDADVDIDFVHHLFVHFMSLHHDGLEDDSYDEDVDGESSMPWLE